MIFFCDTYALVEIIKGNKSYHPYLDQELHTNILNLYGLFYNLLKEYGEITAKEDKVRNRRFKAELKKKDEELAFFYEQHLPNLNRL